MSTEKLRGATLHAQEISVRFGGLAAISGVTFSAEPGKVTGLIGPNGAGKTTTFNVLCGLQASTGGRVEIDGVDVLKETPGAAEEPVLEVFAPVRFAPARINGQAVSRWVTIEVDVPDDAPRSSRSSDRRAR